MKQKKILALVLATAMTAGSSMAVFAADGDPANTATSTGSSFDHVNREITAVTLPTEAAVANVFNYYVDPERLINNAGTLADGNTAVPKNDDGVYFEHAGSAAVSGTISYNIGGDTTGYTVSVSDVNTNASYKYDGTNSKWLVDDGTGAFVDTTVTISATDSSDVAATFADADTVTVSGAQAAGSKTYASSSEAVKFEGKNSVNVEVSVTAAVAATDATKDIKLVADQEALDAATTPALLMTLKVGNEEKAITSTGATAKAVIEGVPDNFEVATESNAFVYQVKADADPDTWKSATVQLAGKTNQMEVPDGAGAMTVPAITLTWTVAKATNMVGYGLWSGDEYYLAKSADAGFSTSGVTVEISDDGGSTYKEMAESLYNLDSNGWLSVTYDSMVEAIGGAPAGEIYLRVTDGTTKYVIKG